MRKILALLLIILLSFALAFVSCDNEESSSTESFSQSESESDSNSVTVKFDTQGAGSIEDITVEKGENIPKPQDPQRAGYTFDSWYIGDEKWSFVGHEATEDMTLVAKWIPVSYTITFSGAKQTSITYTIEDSFELPDGVADDYYEFLGWFEDEDLTSPITKIEEGTYGDKTLYASTKYVALKFALKDGEYSVIGYDGKPTIITIPSTYQGKSVTSIGEKAFEDCTSLIRITIPNRVKTIGELAFSGCINIKKATIPTVAISYIPKDSLQTVEINGGDAIGNDTFDNCTSLISVTIPNSIKTIGSSAFSGCTSLTDIKVDKNNEIYKSIDGNLYSKDSKTLIQYALGKKDASFVIPNSVITIEDGAFSGCRFASVTIGDGVKTIGSSAFYYCYSLTSVTIPDSVTSMGERAFYYCTSLTSVTIGDSVTEIGEQAFYKCPSLTSVTIGNSVTTIGDYAFYDCTKLTSLTIPNSVTEIGEDAFYGCTSLKYNEDNNACYLGNNENPYLVLVKAKNTNIVTCIIDEATRFIYSNAFRNCTSLTSVTIGNSVTTIGDYAFSGCTSLKYNEYDNAYYLGNNENPYLVLVKAKNTNIVTCIIDEATRFIHSSAFRNCTSLTSVTIPNSIISIGEDAFSYCDSLTSVNISDLKSWCNISFGDDSVNPLYYAGNLYLNGKLVTNLVIPNTVSEIKNYAFYGCTSLTSITIPDSVTKIGSSAFRDCTSLTSVTIPDGVKTIGSSVFYNCTSLTSVTIPNSVTSIGYQAFLHCTSLTSVTIPNSVTSIGYQAFSSCTSLASVTIPNSVTSIGNYVFYGCTSLTGIEVDENNETYKSIDGNLYSKDGKTLIQYAIGKKNASFVIPNSVTSIGDSAFENCTSLTSVTIPDGVTSIGFGVFYGCTSLTSVTIPNSVTSIGDYAFYKCTSLTSITIPDSVTSIGDYAFSGCTSLTSVTIPNSVTEIGSSAFRNCTSLTSVTIGDSVTEIGRYAFEDCTSLTSIEVDENNTAYKSIDGNLYSKDGKTLIQYAIGKKDISFVIPDSVTSIGDYAFYDCTSLTSVTIPNSVTSIGDSAFYDCTSLTSVTFPRSVISIGDYAFRNCTSLTSVTIPNSVTSIGFGVFYECTSLKIYAQAQSKPSGWSSYWNDSNCPVVWGHAHFYISGECVCGKSEN